MTHMATFLTPTYTPVIQQVYRAKVLHAFCSAFVFLGASVVDASGPHWTRIRFEKQTWTEADNRRCIDVESKTCELRRLQQLEQIKLTRILTSLCHFFVKSCVAKLKEKNASGTKDFPT